MSSCPRPGCQSVLSPEQVACKRDWFLLPAILRNRIWRLFRSEQGGDEHRAAVFEAIGILAAMKPAPEARDLQANLCRSCGATIRWAVTEKGTAVPLDDNNEDGGNIWIEIPADPREAPIAHYVSKAKPKPEGNALWTSHFASCPNADQHRKPTTKPKGKRA